jgi:hypothetical protein
MIDLNLPALSNSLKLSKLGGRIRVFDPIRKKFLIKTPEEIVRQLVLAYLITVKGYSPYRISVEKTVKVNGLNKRFDILVFDPDMRPWLMIECKAPNIPVTTDTFRQVAMYNLAHRVKYLMVTNGLQSFCCSMDYEQESYTYLTEVPPWFEVPDK